MNPITVKLIAIFCATLGTGIIAIYLIINRKKLKEWLRENEG